MKKIAFIILNVLLINSLSSQNLKSDFRNDSILNKKEMKILNSNFNKTQFHLSMGASITSFNNNTLFSKWVAPELTYKVNSKLNLQLGTMYLNENFTMNSFNSENVQNSSNADFTRAFVYISGDYKINKNLRLRASTFNEVPQKNSQFDNFGYNQVGFDLKITDNFYMSADFISVKGRRPINTFGNNPFFESNLPFGRGSFYPGW